MRMIRQTISLPCLLLLTGSAAYAQLTDGSLTGTVTDTVDTPIFAGGIPNPEAFIGLQHFRRAASLQENSD